MNLEEIPTKPQRQDSLTDQLADLIRVANRLGMYDAADAVTQIHGNSERVRYGCHCDLEEGMTPDGCVIDDGTHGLCIHAKPGMRKEQCRYWRIIDKPTALVMDTKTLKPNQSRIARSNEIYRAVIARLEKGPASKVQLCKAIGAPVTANITDRIMSVQERMAKERHAMVIVSEMIGGFISYRLKPRARRS